MRPPETGDSDGVPSFFLAFIVEHPESVEVWLDEGAVHGKRGP
jgi:hypothetical protein